MKLNDYQKKAITSKIYDDSVAFSYVVLGISGEVGELYEKICQAEEGNVEDDLFKKEIGDVMWYLAAWAEENGIQLEDLAQLKEGDFVGKIDSEDIKKLLIVFSGQIAEFTKKALRDNFEEITLGVYPKDKLEKANVAAANLIEVCRACCFFFIFDFDQILVDNYEKLLSRKKRGKLGGSGDNR